MAQKRNRALNRVEVCCPGCHSRLWRLPGKKFFIFSTTTRQPRELCDVRQKKAALLNTSAPQLTDRTRWIEKFYCTNDGEIWIACARDESGQVTGQVAPSELWQHTAGTIDPRRPNPSVSDYTYRSSRGTKVHSD